MRGLDSVFYVHVKGGLFPFVVSFFKQKLIQNVPMGRMGIPQDVAKVVAFLCSNDADYITGQVICVDGGMAM